MIESMSKFNNSDDIFTGMEATLEKLNHYSEKLSPIVGITILLNPSMKENYLESLGWKTEWIESVMEHFKSAFLYYKQKHEASSISPTTIPSVENAVSSGFLNYKKRKNIVSSTDCIQSEKMRYVCYLH